MKVRPDCSRPAPRHDFTFVELLVVIIIIAVLAAAVSPVFDWFKDRANSTYSLANMRKAATALKSYANDNGGSYPVIERDGALDTSSIPEDLPVDYEVLEAVPNWAARLMILEPDGDKMLVAKGVNWKKPDGTRYEHHELYLTYACTDALSGIDVDGNLDEALPRKRVLIEDVGRTALLIESKQVGRSPFCTGHIAWDEASNDFNVLDPDDSVLVDFRFRNKVVVLMADSSAVAYRPAELRDWAEYFWTGVEYPAGR